MLIFVVEDGGDELSSDLNVHKPETETRNNVVEGVEVTESIEHSSSGQNNGECEVETTEFIERNSSGQNQQRAAVSNLLHIEIFNDAWLIRLYQQIEE